LKEKLAGVVPDEMLALLSSRFHVVGDIAILSLDPELDGYKELIASALLDQCSNVHTVFNKTTPLEGERRISRLELLAGETNSVTVHREFGFRYHLDVARVFFNSRLGYERMRVAGQVKEREEVLVLFAGVGPFAIPPAARGARVVALEKSPEACGWLAVNARENGVEERIAVINADAFIMAALLRKRFDRAIVPTPYGMDRIVDGLPEMMRRGGIIHFYTFKKAQQIEGLKKSYEDLGLEVRLCRRCGNVAPNVSRWAFDMQKI
jgi:tRNA (guanine37-N1)-methyltransferase